MVDAPKPTISITDVARAAGVGVGSVSRVINHLPSVTPAMRLRVLDAMARLNYVPLEPINRPGPKRPRKSGEARQGRVVELLVYNLSIGLGWLEEQAPIYASVLEGIESALSRQGYRLIVRHGIVATDDHTDAVGQIMFGSEPTLLHPKEKPSSLARVWVLGSPPTWFSGDHVTIDNTYVGSLAAMELVRLGHRNCLFLGTSMGSPASPVGYRADGFLHHLKLFGANGQAIIDPGFISTNHTENRACSDKIAKALQPHLGSGRQATAICLQADMLVPAVYAILSQAGIRPQIDMAVITCNNEKRYHQGLRPPPIIVDVQSSQVGMTAVKALLERIENPNLPNRSIGLRSVISP